jgi:hypothetical protein
VQYTELFHIRFNVFLFTIITLAAAFLIASVDNVGDPPLIAVCASRPCGSAAVA